MLNLRGTGADPPFGDPTRSHPGVAMEGYFWRITDPAAGRVIIALCSVNQSPRGTWATIGLGGSDGFLATAEHPGGLADPDRLGILVPSAVDSDADALHLDLGPSARLDLSVGDATRWPPRPFGGSSYFHMVPGLNQYWHPWLLHGTASGVAVLGDQTWRFVDADVYAEKNWGRDGFPHAWWWGQAHGFADPGACVAFAGGEVHAGPVHTTVTGLVVRLPDHRLLRLGNPGTSAVHARVEDGRWRLRGRSARWQVDVDAAASTADAHVLPVPLPHEHRNVPGALENLTGTLEVTVREWGRPLWHGRSRVAGLERGGLELAAAELRHRGVGAGRHDPA